MNKYAVIDSNVLVALLDDRDKWHAQARSLLDALKGETVHVIYFDCILNETISVMARRSEEQNRSAQFSELLDKLQAQVPEDLVTWITPDLSFDRDFDEISWMERYESMGERE